MVVKNSEEWQTIIQSVIFRNHFGLYRALCVWPSLRPLHAQLDMPLETETIRNRCSILLRTVLEHEKEAETVGDESAS